MNRINPFDEIYKLRNQGSVRSKNESLPDFPRIMDVEITNNCNYRCLMCPTGTGSQTRDKGFMSSEVYQKLIDEVSPQRTPLRFIGWGEPTLHKQWLEFLELAKQKNILCHFNTNGTLLNDRDMERIIEIGVDSLKFSFQGVDRTSYRQMRNKDNFDKVISAIKRLFEIRGDNPYPYMHVSTTITYESPELVSAFKEQLAWITDKVTVGRTILSHLNLDKVTLDDAEMEALRALKEQESVIKEHPECPEIFDKLSINWDGSVSGCCADWDKKMVVGHIMDQSLDRIWNSKKMTHYRTKIVNGENDQIELCRHCYDYMSLQKAGVQKT